VKSAIDFTLTDQNGNSHSLVDYKGKFVVLYFYPKDDTPGCTTEACSFRDEREVIAEHGTEIVGVSKDSVESHKKFADKYNLNFTILSDPEHKVIEAYGAWGMMGTKRMTFLINPDGQIAREYPNVTPKEHALQIIQDLEELKK
jgi:peroxiredoxin Q/BCP